MQETDTGDAEDRRRRLDPAAAHTVGYPLPARIFHWVTAACVLTMVPAGLLMLRIPGGATQNWLFDYHRSMGVLLFALTLARLLYRIFNPPPPLPVTVPPMQAFAAKVTHFSLYAILLANPMVGWIGTSAFGAKITVFGLFVLPPIVAKDKDVSEFWLGLHEWLGWAMTALVCLHIAAALHHQFVRRDGLIERMLRS